MKTAVLMYHDIVAQGCEDASGFAGNDAARYKLTPAQFNAHLHAIADRSVVPPTLTFDDGGQSAVQIADALERLGWRGHFFVTTAYVERRGFLPRHHIRDLHARGHVVGSHSHSHPLRMASCSETRLRNEWCRSTKLLADLLGAPVTTASVPGGHYSQAVARTAAEAGVRFLFTSKPTLRFTFVNGTMVIGRYVVRASTRARTAAALVAGDFWPRLRWTAAWELKQACKHVGGPAYLRLRAHLLGASRDVRWGDDLAGASEDPT